MSKETVWGLDEGKRGFGGRCGIGLCLEDETGPEAPKEGQGQKQWEPPFRTQRGRGSFVFADHSEKAGGPGVQRWGVRLDVEV